MVVFFIKNDCSKQSISWSEYTLNARFLNPWRLKCIKLIVWNSAPSTSFEKKEYSLKLSVFFEIYYLFILDAQMIHLAFSTLKYYFW